MMKSFAEKGAELADFFQTTWGQSTDNGGIHYPQLAGFHTNIMLNIIFCNQIVASPKLSDKFKKTTDLEKVLKDLKLLCMVYVKHPAQSTYTLNITFTAILLTF